MEMNLEEMGIGVEVKEVAGNYKTAFNKKSDGDRSSKRVHVLGLESTEEGEPQDSLKKKNTIIAATK